MKKILTSLLISTIIIVLIIFEFPYLRPINNVNNKAKEFILPNDIRVIDLVNKDSIYIQKKSDSRIYTYNLKSQDMKIFKSEHLNNFKIIDMKFSSDWILWTESTDNSYIIFAENKNKNNYKNVYQSEGKNIGNIQLYENYALYQRLDKNIIQIVLVNLKTSAETVINEINLDSEVFISTPSMSKNKIVWSVNKNVNNKIVSDVYIYNIISKEKMVLCSQSNISKPQINQDIIIATMFENNDKYTKSSLVIYDEPSKSWNKIISQNLDIYKDHTNISIDDPIYDESLLTWWDNKSEDMYIYNIKNKKIISLDKPKGLKIGQIYLIKNGYIFYRIIGDFGQKHILQIINTK